MKKNWKFIPSIWYWSEKRHCLEHFSSRLWLKLMPQLLHSKKKREQINSPEKYTFQKQFPVIHTTQANSQLGALTILFNCATFFSTPYKLKGLLWVWAFVFLQHYKINPLAAIKRGNTDFFTAIKKEGYEGKKPFLL